jgi:hypothetical protein
MATIMATTYKSFTNNMGGTAVDNYIGNVGELFWNPSGNTSQDLLRLSNGVTPGGDKIHLPIPFYGAFSSSDTQVSGANTAVALSYNITDFSAGVNLGNSNTEISVSNPGLYNLQFSVQVENTATNTVSQSYIWLRQDNVDIPGSTGTITCPTSHGGLPGAVLVGWNYPISFTTSNSHISLMFFTEGSTTTQIVYTSARAAVNEVSPAIPATLSVVLTLVPIVLY